MREIKFQFWDIRRKRMLTWGDILVEELDGTGFYFDNPECYIPHEYIGLKDKSGKDIYEGDIVKSEDGEIKIIEIEAIGKGCLPFIEIAMGGWQSADGEDCEVIGNIYENPDLLAAS